MKDFFLHTLSLPKVRAQLPLLSRILAASLGGYVLSALFSVATLALPTSRPEAVLWGAQFSFLIWTVTVLGVFLARSATRAWVWLTIIGVLCLIAIAANRWMEGTL
ncbi:DUF3649 domain-containing protein [Alcaligenes faecalis]|uniref:DUF3649 domain-containing protein n=1 Tax=Alcaligenes faecalis TaxID=511 RepID=UPI001C82B6DB|nr:DUF3649 domain-containing protein [Alcaligenes faecalis]MBX6964186.1 DUF3649 domain-containing protein [Providencia rettgeri]MBX7029437.1 DUF3649 domain-containing protein [Alcaligenes faecalis]